MNGAVVPVLSDGFNAEEIERNTELYRHVKDGVAEVSARLVKLSGQSSGSCPSSLC